MTKLRFILFPFSLIYALITEVRNFMFDVGLLKSTSFDVSVVSVGNLSVGGTGKTPMVLWLANMLTEKGKKVAIISRGYGRKTKGFRYVETNDLAENVGDEPLLFKQNLPNCIVAVGEKRVEAIEQILEENSVDIILLDDAFQHRYIKPSLNILLSDYNRPFYKDFILPVGNLRELRKNKKRADIIITTKLPKTLKNDEKTKLFSQIKPEIHQKCFFSWLNYETPISIFNQSMLSENVPIIIITGIANPQPMLQYLSDKYRILQHITFPDHHHYNSKDTERIIKTYKNLSRQKPVFVTTTKDAVKLSRFSSLKILPLYALPIEPKFDDENTLKQLILEYDTKH